MRNGSDLKLTKYFVYAAHNWIPYWTCFKSLSRKKREKEKKRERLVILGMLINIHELSGLASMFKMTGAVSCVLGILPLMKSAQRLKTLTPHEKNGVFFMCRI